METIHRAITVEDLVREYPDLVGYLVVKGLPCLVCGEPVWGTFEEFARKYRKTEGEIDLLIEEMNAMSTGKKQ